MNKSYRLVYNEITNTWVAVAETVRGRGKRTSGALLLVAAGVMMPLVQAPAWAGPPVAVVSAPAPTQLPTGGQVVAGQASLNQIAATLNVNPCRNGLRCGIAAQEYLDRRCRLQGAAAGRGRERGGAQRDADDRCPVRRSTNASHGHSGADQCAGNRGVRRYRGAYRATAGLASLRT